MPGAGVVLAVPTDINRIEAPVTFKAYLTCAFAAFAGIFFGFDTGYSAYSSRQFSLFQIVSGAVRHG
jgi:hypothetical protein